MHDTAPPFALYNPALMPPESLLAEFAARKPLLARLVEIVRDNQPGAPPQHVLIVGPRGLGKTTLLCAVSASIKLREPELRAKWQPVVFGEESRRIGDLADFWIECVGQWEAATEPTLVESARIDALLRLPADQIEDRAREAFLKLVDESGKRALLLIDNLNDVFVAIHDVEALLRLRSFLMADDRVMIIGAATRWFSDVSNVDKPFFEFFRGFELQTLSLPEMRECLAGIAQARGDQRVLEALEKRPLRIEALHILTGGNPRLVRIFYRLLNEGANGDLRQQLERLVDDYTPYLKAIIDALPGQQQRVLDAIAMQWNPCEVATVSHTTRLPSNQVSAQIKALVKAGLVSEVPALGSLKRKSYMLTDRFSNIHYLMRHGRAVQQRMHWYVMTLRALFEDDEFADAAAQTVKLTAHGDEGQMQEAVSLAMSVLENAGSESAKQRFLDRVTGSAEFDNDVDVVLAEKVCREAIARNPQDAFAHHKWGRLLDVHLKRPVDAEAAYRRAIHLDPVFAVSWNNLGYLLSKDPNRQSEAIEAYQKAIELDPNDAWPWNNLGNLMQSDPSRQLEAEAAYRRAIEIEPNFAWPWNNLGYLITRDSARQSEAEFAIRRAIELDPEFAGAWYNLGLLISRDNTRQSEAEAAYRRSIDLNIKFAWPHRNLARLLSKQPNRIREAKAHITRGLTLQPDDPVARNVFYELCFLDADLLRTALPEVSRWSSAHPEDHDVATFLVDAWLAYARCASVKAARELLEAQPPEVQLVFESIHDAFVAFDQKDHLHRLAPERRALVLKLLEFLRAEPPAK